MLVFTLFLTSWLQRFAESVASFVKYRQVGRDHVSVREWSSVCRKCVHSERRCAASRGVGLAFVNRYVLDEMSEAPYYEAGPAITFYSLL